MSVLPVLLHGEVSGQAANPWPAVRGNVVMIVQGENDVTAGKEHKDDFYALKIISYELPLDSNRVYTSMPADAGEIKVWHQGAPLNDSMYGRETSGNMSGEFYVDVPASYNRNADFVNTTANESAFGAAGSVAENVSYSGSALRLSSGLDNGSYLSTNFIISSAFNILSGNLTYSGTLLENVTGFLSNDGGVSWTPCQNATEFNFTTSGTTLKARFLIDGNSTLGIAPSITSFRIAAKYVQLKTVLTLHVSYLWTQVFTDRQTTIDLSEAMPYTSSESFLVMLYTLKGYEPKGVGFELTLDQTNTMNTYPDKDLYLYSTSSLPSGGNVTIDITAPKPDYGWVLYLAGGAAFLAAFGLLLLGRKKRIQRARASAKTGAPVAEGSSDVDKESRRKELVARKKEILSEIDELKGKNQDGKTRADAETRLDALKDELKQVRNELNKLPRTPEPSAAGPAAQDVPGMAGEPYESAMASLARLDDDFEKGRLPESTYKTLRKEYVSKAAVLMASGRKAQADKENPLVAEKNKLMEAILALDDEHERGELDEKVYKELRASYRKELAAVMQRLDQEPKEE